MSSGLRLVDRFRTAPVLADEAAAERRFADWVATSDTAGSAALSAARPLLLALADHSPFLWRLVTADAARCVRLLTRSPEQSLDVAIGALGEFGWNAGADGPALMRTLRRSRQTVALLVALADLGGVWTLDEVTAALTRFADAAVRTAVCALLREAVSLGRLHPPEADDELECGLAVLALGKQGGGELNYSSDIDLIALFDAGASRLPEKTVPSKFYVRLVQQLVRLLQELTEDGYVFRVDLRLRPDPASTAVAIGLPSAFSYYESYGQNWERAAFIKARPVAGDLAMGERFLAGLAPFIWRKYFDFAAIADIHAMKRQIHAVRGQGEVAVEGHNVKLGRGGIREIEFFVQTQQLIFGGRRPGLRGRRTVRMLEALAADGWIDSGTVADLSAAYRFLRTIEHRLQMLADEQTQRLPETDAELERFARFAGFDSRAAFAEALLFHLRIVERHYAQLFEHAPGLGSRAGNLVFTGTTADPETLDTLRAMGFARPETAAEIIRGWHFGRRPGVQSARAREVVTELTPALLEAFAGSSDPDGALATMDSMLGRMMASVELLSLLRSHAALLDLFADILGSAPRLATTLATRPHLLDAAIDPALSRGPHPAELTARLIDDLRRPRSLEDFLDRARDLLAEEHFLVGVQLLSGAIEPQRAGQAYSRLAELTVQAMFERCCTDFAGDHGLVPGASCIVLAMGKLGSREMSATSDLDLIVIYDADPEAGPSDGTRPLDAARYYTRLTQRLIAALTAPTRRGRLYEVDVRLRPSGRQGPLATQLRSFVRYQAQDAQTWEHMALTRARVVAGDASLAARVEAAIRTTLTASRDAQSLKAEVRSMRALVAKEKGETEFWDLKLAKGGLLDIEFLAQYLVLRFGAQLSLIGRAPLDTLIEARRLDLLPPDDADVLIASYEEHTALTQLVRLMVDGRFDPGKTGAGVVRRLCAAVNQPDLSALQDDVSERRAAVRAIFDRLLSSEQT